MERKREIFISWPKQDHGLLSDPRGSHTPCKFGQNYKPASLDDRRNNNSGIIIPRGIVIGFSSDS